MKNKPYLFYCIYQLSPDNSKHALKECGQSPDYLVFNPALESFKRGFALYGFNGGSIYSIMKVSNRCRSIPHGRDRYIPLPPCGQQEATNLKKTHTMGTCARGSISRDIEISRRILTPSSTRSSRRRISPRELAPSHQD